MACVLAWVEPRIDDVALGEARVRELLQPFRVDLTSGQMSQLLVYLELLLRWSRRINLTSIGSAEGCVTRHFGESLYLASATRLEGSLLDIGSGAGFPGLALKIAFPALALTLLEPVAKKRAFLKEVARACSMEGVEVRRERLEEFVGQGGGMRFSAVTARAVGQLPQLLHAAASLLAEGGRLGLWLTRRQAVNLPNAAGGSGILRWMPPLPIPFSREREIWIGVRREE